jgi:hypothetical protein
MVKMPTKHNSIKSDDDALATIHTGTMVTGDSAANLRKLADRGSLPCQRTVEGVRLFRLGDLRQRARDRQKGRG